MIVNDNIYGKVKITSPVLIELIKSASMQRLKKIAQCGIPNKYYHIISGNRFDHCVGVMLLLKQLGATEEEQVAGLLHDVSHTAFSHVIDWVVGTGQTEDYQDNQHAMFINGPEISKILRKYKIDTKRIANYHHYFSLLETDIPDLCADRVDYALREFPYSTTKRLVKFLTVGDEKIVFKNEKNALDFARNYAKRQEVHWGGYEAVVRYSILAKILKKALSLKIITMKDFLENDAYIINILIDSKDKQILETLKILKQKSLSNLAMGEKIVQKKFRFVDPLFLCNGSLRRLSVVNKQYKLELENARKENSQGITLPLIAI